MPRPTGSATGNPAGWPGSNASNPTCAMRSSSACPTTLRSRPRPGCAPPPRWPQCFWGFRGLYGEGRRWLDRALAHPGDTRPRQGAQCRHYRSRDATGLPGSDCLARRRTRTSRTGSHAPEPGADRRTCRYSDLELRLLRWLFEYEPGRSRPLIPDGMTWAVGDLVMDGMIELRKDAWLLPSGRRDGPKPGRLHEELLQGRPARFVSLTPKGLELVERWFGGKPLDLVAWEDFQDRLFRDPALRRLHGLTDSDT